MPAGQCEYDYKVVVQSVEKSNANIECYPNVWNEEEPWLLPVLAVRRWFAMGGLPLNSWSESILTATYLINWLPTVVLRVKCPYELVCTPTGKSSPK
ncbi:hypothetical protein Tco_1132250 [Tanacetum coccineum]|uniref:Uncharacterized protein n=1 Tax=Tanacetum coccineum TaxID=301880 RepID=A0ABQ5JFH4_9ASTR